MRIAQFSDLHLKPAGQLYEGLVDSNGMAEAAIETLNRLWPPPDVVLISGDIVDDGEAGDYALARQMLAAIAPPVLAIPGNHDEREAFRCAFAGQRSMTASGPVHFVVGDLGPVRIIGFDITVPGAHHGAVEDAALAWLEQALEAEPDRPTVIMMHQPPFESGIPFIDDYNCAGGERLAALIRRFPAVERVLCGHIHRSMQLRFGGTLLMTAPSTTTAIALRLHADASPASYVEPPAFLLHHYQPQTGLITHHVPVGRFRGPLPFF